MESRCGRKWHRAESGVRALRAQGLMLLPASFVTDAGQVSSPLKLQLPVPCSEGGWTPCQRDRKPADGREEGPGGRRHEAGASSGLCELLGCQRLAGEWPGRGLHTGFWNKHPARAWGTAGPPSCGPAPGTFLPVAGFSLHGSVSSTSAFWTPFPLRCFRELCLGLHISSCWMKT